MSLPLPGRVRSRAQSSGPRLLSPLLMFAVLLLWATDAVFASQIIAPSNDTLYAKFGLRIQLTAMINAANITPLTIDAARQAQTPTSFKAPIQLITDSNVDSFDSSYIAYISCDPSGDGRSTEDSVYSTAVGRHPVAIVLYSNSLPFCTVTPSSSGDTIRYSSLFSMTNTASSIAFENFLKQAQGVLSTVSSPSQSTPVSPTPSGTGTNGMAASPTTTVAMIILYSITGLVTALFLIIIATGAIRAHRHPERYGPRRAGPSGRQRQSRAKGLARAVLESIPIVKFGEKDDKPPGGDVELGTDQQRSTPAGGDGAADTHGSGDQHPRPQGGELHGASPRAGEDSDIVPAMPTVAGGDSDQIQPSVENPPTRSDEGLSCSICTEDFVKGEDIRVLPCNHKYHPDCVDPWLLNVSGTCPLCRIDLSNNLNQDPEYSPSSPDPHPNSSLPPPLDIPPGTSSTQTENDTGTPPPSRRSRYLDLRRLAHAHPEERISVLRRLREANQQASDQDGLQRRRRASRLSSMFRVFGIRNGQAQDGGSGPSSGSHPSPSGSEPSPAENSSPPVESGSPAAENSSPPDESYPSPAESGSPPAENSPSPASPPVTENNEAARERADTGPGRPR